MPANDERLLGPERSKSEQVQTLIKLSYILPLLPAAAILLRLAHQGPQKR